MKNVLRFLKSCRGLGLLIVLAGLSGARADVRLPRIFTDNMMLQRAQPICVWGSAAPGESVKVTLAGQEASAAADAEGKWTVKLPALKQGENLELTVAGKNTLVVKNVIMGDIWLCSGQSNMEMQLNGCNAPEDVKNANFPKIRRVKFNHVTAADPQDEASLVKPWEACTPQTAGDFSAAGFYFAREISQRTGVPIGILDCNWGGTPIEPWVAPAGLEQVPELKDEITKRLNAMAAYRSELPKALDNMEKWVAAARLALQSGARVLPQSPLPPDPAASGWYSMYNAMVHPLVRLPIKGALWYQGESNGGEGISYYHKMNALISGWRQVWGQGDFPFYYVQLANWVADSKAPAGGDGWSNLRNAQTKALALPNTGMAVIIDIGDANDIHPKNKYDVGLRLARWALARDYGQKDLVVSGPLYRDLKIAEGKIRLSFEQVGSGLIVGKKNGLAPVVEDKTGKLQRFAVAGADKVWHWADAVIDGATVVVSSPEVKEPVAVRYAYSQNPEGANLYNKEGLPASPFRSDDW